MHNTAVANPSQPGRLHLLVLRLISRLLPQHLSEVAVCNHCRKACPKREMYYVLGYGWFCTEARAIDIWKMNP